MTQIDTGLAMPPASVPDWGARAVSALRDSLRSVPLLRDIKRGISRLGFESELQTYRASDIAQKALIAQWRQLHAQGVVLPFDQVGFSRFSEFEEDGMLLYLLTLAGAESRVVVEISAQDGRTCMASNLIIHHRFKGFLFDGDPVFERAGRKFFARHPATRAAPPVVATRWFDRTNINTTLTGIGVPPDIDVLSLDIDGNDLYLWSSLVTVRPRILICEFNNAVPPGRAVTIPYRTHFHYTDLPASQALFRSASLDAYIAVSRRKGYRFVGMNALGFNAIFLRDDVLAKEFPERSSTVLNSNAAAQAMRAEWWTRLQDLPWVDVHSDGEL